MISSLRFPRFLEEKNGEKILPLSLSREDLRHIWNSKQFCGSIGGKESERGEKTRLVDVIADKTASIFCRKVEIVPGTHGGIPAKTDNDRQHAANRAG